MPLAARKRFTASAFRNVRSRSKSRNRPRGSPRPTMLQLAVAICCEQCHVDAVHRGAAHQPERALKLAHPTLPVQLPTPPGNRAAETHTGVMAKLKSDFLRTLHERGFVDQCPDEHGLDALAEKGEIVAYVGYDCTAPSLHVGSLLSIMMLRWLQQAGGKPIVLMGGGTTRVGGPSGKDELRKIMSLGDIESK